MHIKRIILLCCSALICPLAWSSVFVTWTDAALPPASSLGVTEIVVPWQPSIRSGLLSTAKKQGYRVYVESSMKQAAPAAKACVDAGCAGVIVSIAASESTDASKYLANLRSAFAELRFLWLTTDGKQPQMKGSIVVKRDSVLEVSSPTEQPWLDTNLALIRVEQRAQYPQSPFYTFSWDDQEQTRSLTADDYSLAVAEAAAFHADLLLPLDEHLQRSLNRRDANAWATWKQIRSILDFSAKASETELSPAANVAVILDQLDSDDEVLNLLSRHNIPFRIFQAPDLKSADFKNIDLAVVLAKPDPEAAEHINHLAEDGKTLVLVDAHGKFPWQSSSAVKVNEYTTSYAVGSGIVLELAEPVSDPETFARDIHRLLGKGNALLSLWNGLTTIAVPYQDASGALRLVELVNYAGEPLRVQVQVKGSFPHVRYESPEHRCCQTLDATTHDGFTEFVIPDLQVTGRVHLEPQ